MTPEEWMRLSQNRSEALIRREGGNDYSFVAQWLRGMSPFCCPTYSSETSHIRIPLPRTQCESVAPQRLLEMQNRHLRDGDLVFVAETHTYYLHNKALPLSVTGLVHLFVQDFDADKAIPQMRRGRNWPRPQYCDARGEPLADDCIKAVGGCVKFPVQVEL